MVGVLEYQRFSDVKVLHVQKRQINKMAIFQTVGDQTEIYNYGAAQHMGAAQTNKRSRLLRRVAYCDRCAVDRGG